jgi:ketosteroid isomerase-like protein
MKTSILAAAAGLILLAAMPALARDFTPEQIIRRHMAFGARSDTAGMAGDYAEDAVILSAGSVVRGKAAIRASIDRLMGPKAAKMDFRPVKITHDGNVGIVFWQVPNGPHGEDAFVVRHGKIQVQAVFMGATPSAPGH